MNTRIESKYINLDGKLIKVQGDNLYFDNKKIHLDTTVNGNTSLFTNPPAYPNASGKAGDIAFDNKYFYICISSNTWIRTALASW